MRQLIVELSDQEMDVLEVLAKAEHLAPGSLAKLALLKVLAERAGETSQSSDSVGAQQPDLAHAKRLAAAMTMHGIWRGKADKPQDGVAYQREVRAE
jgi:hypothetical protein